MVSFIAALAGLLFGFDTGIISGALLFVANDFTLSTWQKELIVSSVLVGAMCSSVASGFLTDRYGRRRIMLVIAGLFVIGTVLATLANSMMMLVIGRAIIGIAIGIGSYTAPLYIAEAAPIELRGGLVSLNQLMITIGIMCSYFISYMFTQVDGSWRYMFAIGVVPAILLGLGMLLLPESPRWLIKQGLTAKAGAILQRLRQKQNVEHEIQEIQASMQFKQAGVKDIFAAWIRPVLFLGIFLGFLQQASGINTLIYYAPTIFQLAGFHDASSSILATVGLGIVNVLSTIFAIFYLDKWGRRPLLFAGLIGMAVSLTSLSLAFYFGNHFAYLHWLAFASTFVYIISFAFSLGALLWLMVAEIFPLEVRGIAMGFAVFSCWFWNFVVSATFLSLLNALGPSITFLLYASICFIGLFICYKIVPETKDVSLEQIEANIRAGLPLRKIGKH